MAFLDISELISNPFAVLFRLPRVPYQTAEEDLLSETSSLLQKLAELRQKIMKTIKHLVIVLTIF